ncbi:MAG: glycosyltransferase family 39 protein [Ignavibacteria bacterium]|nr:glycosyltransferase family 39 protein [Ignavibacteria bacterium]
MTITNKPFLFPKLFKVEGFKPNEEPLERTQLIAFIICVLVTIIIKTLVADYSMIDHGEGATRTWNALWWAQKPFFVEPLSGNPGWFYFIGPLIQITMNIYFMPIFTMILAMTLGGIYIFKITLLFSNYRTALIAFFIYTLHPVLFRLNFTPLPQQFYLAAICIMIYYFIKAVASQSDKLSLKYFIIAGVFSFISLTFRPEGLFTLLSFCGLAFVSRRRGAYIFILLTILFQLIWMAVSYQIHGSFFATFKAVRDYDFLVGANIADAPLGVRARGFFLPYYFIVVGTTFILFYFMIKGAVITYKRVPFFIFLTLFFPVFFPAFVNGLQETMSAAYDTTRYFYLTFYFCSVFTAIGIEEFIKRFKIVMLQNLTAAVIVLTAIPLSYIKDLVPYKYNKLFPKVIQFISTSEDPEDARQMIKFIDENITAYPALIFDSEGSDSSIMYIPFRTKLAPPEKIMIAGYNIAAEKDSLKTEIRSFMKKNPRGIIMYKKEPTLFNSVFSELTAPRQYIRGGMVKAGETAKWIIYTYEPTEEIR